MQFLAWRVLPASGHQERTSNRPSRKVVPVVPDFLLTIAIRPDLVIPLKARSASDVRLCYVGAIALKLFVVSERFPRNSVMMRANAKESPIGHVYVENATTYLLDQQPFNSANLIIVAVEYGCAFDAITFDNEVRYCWSLNRSPEIKTVLDDAGRYDRPADGGCPFLVGADFLHKGPWAKSLLVISRRSAHL